MIKINDFDLTEFENQRLPFSFKFSDYPGSLIFSPFTELTLQNPRDDFLNPLNRYSPLYPITKGEYLSIYIKDEGSGFVKQGIVTHAQIVDGSVVQLTIEDQFQKVIEKQQVLADYSDKVPVEIARLIAESYGIKVNLVRYGMIRQWQEDEGLQFDYIVLPSHELTLVDTINQLCQAGFMRATIFLDEIYFIGIEQLYTDFEIFPQEIHNIPSQTAQLKERYGGGSIKWLAGTQTKEFDETTGKSEINLDYSGANQLTLINGNGAESLLEFYSDITKVGSFFNIAVKADIIERLLPGEAVIFRSPALNRSRSVKAQLIERQPYDPYNPFTLNCVFEVLPDE